MLQLWVQKILNLKRLNNSIKLKHSENFGVIFKTHRWWLSLCLFFLVLKYQKKLYNLSNTQRDPTVLFSDWLTSAILSHPAMKLLCLLLIETIFAFVQPSVVYLTMAGTGTKNRRYETVPQNTYDSNGKLSSPYSYLFTRWHPILNLIHSFCLYGLLEPELGVRYVHLDKKILNFLNNIHPSR